MTGPGRWGSRRRDGGFTLVEMLVTMIMLGIVMGVSVSFFTSAQHANSYTDAFGQQVYALRQGLQRLTKELRMAAALQTSSTADAITFWVDSDSDGIQQPTELVTYRVTGGRLTRSTAAAGTATVVARGIANAAAFTYYKSDGTVGAAGSSTRLVEAQFTAQASSGGQTPAQRTVSTDIYLRGLG